MSPYTSSSSVWVAASPADVYAVVSDVSRTGEWSPRCVSCTWDDGVSAGSVGVAFTGDNVRAGRRWSTTNRVVAADSGREFAWEVNGGLVRWGFVLEAADGGTRLTETWEFRDAGLHYFQERFGDRAPAEIAERVEAARTGMPGTLAAIKRVIESPGSPELDLLALLDHVWRRLAQRLIGLTDDELDRQPVAGSRESTLRWRLVHLAGLLGDERNARGLGVTTPTTDRAVGSVDGAASDVLMALGQAFDEFRLLAADPSVDHSALLGPVAGPYATSTKRAYLLHVVDELIHHGAETALLRDLWSAR